MEIRTMQVENTAGHGLFFHPAFMPSNSSRIHASILSIIPGLHLHHCLAFPIIPFFILHHCLPSPVIPFSSFIMRQNGGNPDGTIMPFHHPSTSDAIFAFLHHPLFPSSFIIPFHPAYPLFFLFSCPPLPQQALFMAFPHHRIGTFSAVLHRYGVWHRQNGWNDPSYPFGQIPEHTTAEADLVLRFSHDRVIWPL